MTAARKDATRAGTGQTRRVAAERPRGAGTERPRRVATERRDLGTSKLPEVASKDRRVWVLDASVSVRWLLAAGAEPDAQRVMERVVESPGSFAVPELFAFETFAVIARHHSDPLGAFSRSILPVLSSGVLRHPMGEKLAEASMPFVGRGLTGYDACYAGLASLLGGTWLMFDAEAHRRLAGTGVSFLLGHGVPAGF